MLPGTSASRSGGTNKPVAGGDDRQELCHYHGTPPATLAHGATKVGAWSHAPKQHDYMPLEVIPAPSWTNPNAPTAAPIAPLYDGQTCAIPLSPVMVRFIDQWHALVE